MISAIARSGFLYFTLLLLLSASLPATATPAASALSTSPSQSQSSLTTTALPPLSASTHSGLAQEGDGHSSAAAFGASRGSTAMFADRDIADAVAHRLTSSSDASGDQTFSAAAAYSGAAPLPLPMFSSAAVTSISLVAMAHFMGMTTNPGAVHRETAVDYGFVASKSAKHSLKLYSNPANHTFFLDC